MGKSTMVIFHSKLLNYQRVTTITTVTTVLFNPKMAMFQDADAIETVAVAAQQAEMRSFPCFLRKNSGKTSEHPGDRSMFSDSIWIILIVVVGKRYDLATLWLLLGSGYGVGNGCSDSLGDQATSVSPLGAMPTFHCDFVVLWGQGHSF
jgi:hypothetical protein